MSDALVPTGEPGQAALVSFPDTDPLCLYLWWPGNGPGWGSVGAQSMDNAYWLSPGDALEDSRMRVFPSKAAANDAARALLAPFFEATP